MARMRPAIATSALSSVGPLGRPGLPQLWVDSRRGGYSDEPVKSLVSSTTAFSRPGSGHDQGDPAGVWHYRDAAGLVGGESKPDGVAVDVPDASPTEDEAELLELVEQS